MDQQLIFEKLQKETSDFMNCFPFFSLFFLDKFSYPTPYKIKFCKY